MTKGKITVGTSILVIGFIGLIISFFFPFIIVHSLIVMGIGIAIIILHDSDAKIEQRKDLNKSKKR